MVGTLGDHLIDMLIHFSTICRKLPKEKGWLCEEFSRGGVGVDTHTLGWVWRKEERQL